MAEIKNTFLKGKMNKDLDERLVPKGEYRNALNVEISTSEGSNIGTVQNILGNYRVDNEINSDEYKCIATIADERKNRIFWFVTSKKVDAILEWDENLQQSDLIFVDVNKRNNKAALKFPNTIITGINVIDEFLLWTDGISEPKKINIEACRKGTTSLVSQTKLFIENKVVLVNEDLPETAANKVDVQESHITIIKKKPTNPPFSKVNHSETNTEKSIFEKVFPRFCYRYKYADGEYSAFGPFTKPIFSAKHIEDVNSLNYYDLKHGHNRSMANTIESIELMDFVPSDIPLDVVQVDLLYKREDSNVVYSIANIKTGDDEFNVLGSASGGYFETNTQSSKVRKNRGRYLVKSESVYAAIPDNQLLRSWDNVPRKALAQEVSGNRLIYANYTQGYDLGNISTKVKAYYEARDVKGADKNLGGIESIKAQREYQIGIVYGDKYGRETPVFTSTDASVKVPWVDNYIVDGPSFLTPLALSAVVETAHPEWSEYFKFYVKQTSGEYYNLLMDRVYMPSSSTDFENKEDHVWLAFPSSEINKIQEDDYIILKKVSSAVEKHVEEKNRYKVIDIKAEAPDSVAYAYLEVGEVSNKDVTTNLANSGEEDSLFQNADRRIDVQTDTIEIDKSSWIAFGFPTLRGSGNNAGTNSGVDNATDHQELYVSWKRVAAGFETHSRRYKSVAVQIDSDHYKIKLNEKINRDDANLALSDQAAADSADNGLLHQDLVFTVHRKEKRDRQDFSGKFFVKILADEIVREYLTGLDSNASTTRFVSSSKSLFWWADIVGDKQQESSFLNQSNFSGYGTNPETQPNDLTEISGITNTEADWAFLLTAYGKRLFIDNMFMAAANLSTTGYAKESGRGTVGNPVLYGKADWNSEAATNEELPAWNLNANSTWASAEGQDTGAWKDNVVNGMSGLIEAGPKYTNGVFSWKKSIHSQEVDETYGKNEGSFFMHLSFLAPGKNLNDGTFGGDSTLSNVDIAGENSIAGLLQGIWGGGAFTTQNAALLNTDDGVETKFIEFEGNYIDTSTMLADAPGPGVGKGYDLEYKEYHERQWDPTFSPSRWSFDSASEKDERIEEFFKNIAIGKKFRFKGDETEELYTILDFSIKHIYNHTPWRTKFIVDNGDVVVDEGSVEYAAAEWATAKQDGDQATIDAKGEALAKKITDFGKADNRRTTYILRLDKNPNNASHNPTIGGNGNTDLDTLETMQFVDDKAQALSGLVKDVSALFETEPKDSVDLNIFYEAGQAIPTYLTTETVNQFAPPGCRVEIVGVPEARRGAITIVENIILVRWEISPITSEVSFVTSNELLGQEGGGYGFNRKDSNGIEIDYSEARVRFYREDGSYTSCRLGANINIPDNEPQVYSTVQRLRWSVNKTIDPALQMGLSWYNCITFGDGVESDRIRDDFNAMRISNGARASTTIDQQYEEEQRRYGLIYSGLYNSQTGLNSINQFIQAEKITKDLNPTYGSIQKLFSRTSDLIAFCEDRVVKILANKDAVFNADGNPQLVATTNVLGQATPFVGDYGISSNPESFSKESYRAYFTDKQRGAVLRLSMDGLTPISDAGMHDFFRDKLPTAGVLLGTYDDYKKQYNLSFKEFVYNNILENSYVSEGEEVSTLLFETEIIENPGLESGVSYTPVDIQSLYAAQQNNPVLQNSDLDSSVKIIHWPAIGVGGITAFQAEEYEEQVVGYDTVTYNINADGNVQQTNVGATVSNPDFLPEVNAVFPTFSYNGGYMHRNENNIGENNWWVNDNYGSDFHQYAYGGTTKAYKTYGGSYDNDILFYGLRIANEPSGYDYSFGAAGSLVEISGNPISNNAQNIVPTGMQLPEFEQPLNMSVFTGEELFVLIHYRVQAIGAPGGIDGESNGLLLARQNDIEITATLVDKATGGTNNHFRSSHLTSAATGNSSGVWQGAGGDVNNSSFHSNSGYFADDNNSFPTTYTEAGFSTTESTFASTGTGNVITSTAPSFTWTVPGGTSTYETTGYGGYTQYTADRRIQIPFKIFSNPINTNNVEKVVGDLAVLIETNATLPAPSESFSVPQGNSVYITGVAVYKRYEMQDPGSVYQASAGPETVAAAAEYGYVEGTLTNEIIDDVLVTVGVDDFPASEIPAWSEVVHTTPANWSLIGDVTSDNYAALNQAAIDTYGVANPGAWANVPTYTDIDGNVVNSGSLYYSGTSNGVTAYQNAGTEINVLNGVDIPSYQGTVKEEVEDVNDEINISQTVAGSKYIQQTLAVDLIEGDYYAVDIEFEDNQEFEISDSSGQYSQINVGQTPGTLRLKGCIPLDVATAANLDTHETVSDYYPDGHYGQVNLNGSSGDLLFMLRDFVGYGDVQGPVLRAVFKADANTVQGLSTIKIGAHRIQGTYKSIDIVNVSEQGSGGDFSQYWTTTQTASLVNALSEPTSYYTNGGWAWNFPQSSPNLDDAADNKIIYSFDNNELSEATEQGYSLTFKIDSILESGLVEGAILLHVSQVPDADGEYEMLKIEQINAPGTYTVKFNYDDTEPQLFFEGDTTATATMVTTSAANTSSQILVRPYQSGFVGKLTLVSIVDETTIVSGGTSNSWVFSQVNSTTNSIDVFTSASANALFENQQIVFNDASEGTQVSQSISQIISEGETYNVSFDFTPVLGVVDFEVYYYTNQGKGFKIESSGDPNNLGLDGFITFDEDLTIEQGQNFNSATDLTESLVIRILGSNQSMSIDNITMTRFIEPNADDNTTVSYSEDVKGWVSFKSFIPENGLSLSKKYFTFNQGKIFQHYYSNFAGAISNFNKFYDVKYESTITTLLNDSPDIVKTYRTLTYEGSQGKILAQSGLGDANSWNKTAVAGWEVSDIRTNMAKGSIKEFIEKEEKWFNYINGAQENIGQVDISLLNFQGLGTALADAVVVEAEQPIQE